ncbi:Phospholipase/Carboxylesterase-domain-containing protein [Melampsora americana]|nr:Phospholipase/Carboxylesterase-domain-containing protein [Melampsora americana]
MLGAHLGPRLLHRSNSLLHSSSSTTLNVTLLGSELNPPPPPEHLVSQIYRSDWTLKKPGITPLEFDVLEPIDPRQGKGIGWTVVFLHGLGSVNSTHGYQWRETILSTLNRPLDQQKIGNLSGLRFILPKAPVIPITVYSNEPKGGERPGWFDIKDWRDLNYLEDEEGLKRSCIQIASIIIEQIKGSKMQMNKTIIAGFSQGAVMSLLTSLLLFEPPAATLILSGYLPLPFRLPLLLSSTPGFYQSASLYWIHGTKDNVLNYNAAKSGFQLFQSISHEAFGRAKFKTLPGLDHGFSEDEAIVVTNWIEGIVDRNTQGEFDEVLDNLIQPENQIDDLQYPVGKYPYSTLPKFLTNGGFDGENGPSRETS